MALRRIVEPEPLFEPEHAKVHCRIDSESEIEDGYLEHLIRAATDFCEKWQRRAYRTQTWELYLDGWPVQPWIRIDVSPLQSARVFYYDTQNVQHEFTAFDIDPVSEPGYVLLRPGASWPSIGLRSGNGVRIEFVCGYGDTEDVPSTMTHTVALMVSHLYENREPIETGGRNIGEIPFSLRSMLNQNKVYI